MNTILNFIQSIKQEYKPGEMPFLAKQLTRANSEKPYKNISILHNIPFTKETLLKLEILYAGGANIVVSSPSFMEVDKNLVDSFVASGGNWQKEVDFSNQTFDFHLDCAAELITKNPPRIGTVEITGTGTNKYGAAQLNYPVISVDQSTIKNLEGVLGTGEAFLRAFEELTTQDTTNQSFMIFGYGKVGKGIAHYLKKRTNHIVIIEKDKANIESAKNAGFECYSSDNKTKIESLASTVFAIVTATGIDNVISDNYDCTKFKAKYLANMGGEDEFGYSFEAEKIMCQKRPINFFVDKPTLMRYLDPVFYAHNLGVDILLYGNLSNGMHPFPSFISEEVVNEWGTIFNEKATF